MSILWWALAAVTAVVAFAAGYAGAALYVDAKREREAAVRRKRYIEGLKKKEAEK